MKAHIARNQNAGIPLALGWNLSAADRGILEGMAPTFGMKLLLVSPADAGKTVAQLLGEVEVKTTRTLVLEPGAYPPALVLANFKDKDVDTLQAHAFQLGAEFMDFLFGGVLFEYDDHGGFSFSCSGTAGEMRPPCR